LVAQAKLQHSWSGSSSLELFIGPQSATLFANFPSGAYDAVRSGSGGGLHPEDLMESESIASSAVGGALLEEICEPVVYSNYKFI